MRTFVPHPINKVRNLLKRKREGKAMTRKPLGEPYTRTTRRDMVVWFESITIQDFELSWHLVTRLAILSLMEIFNPVMCIGVRRFFKGFLFDLTKNLSLDVRWRVVLVYLEKMSSASIIIPKPESNCRQRMHRTFAYALIIIVSIILLLSPAALHWIKKKMMASH